MAIISIDGKEYDVDMLSADAKTQLNNIQFVDAEIARTNAILAVLHTARVAYGSALNEELSKFGESIRFS